MLPHTGVGEGDGDTTGLGETPGVGETTGLGLTPGVGLATGEGAGEDPGVGEEGPPTPGEAAGGVHATFGQTLEFPIKVEKSPLICPFTQEPF